jgi:TM2 domain-containing membrane protein YozV
MAFYAQPGAQTPPNQPMGGPQPGPYGQYPPQYPPMTPNYVQVPRGSHSPGVATILNIFCFIGLGQIYNKQPLKGVLMLLFSMGMCVVTAGVAVVVLVPVGAIDAYLIGQKLNQGRPVGLFEFF